MNAHLDPVDLLDGLGVFAGGCQGVHGVCGDPAHGPRVQQLRDGPQATRQVGLGAHAGQGLLPVLPGALDLPGIRKQQISKNMDTG